MAKSKYEDCVACRFEEIKAWVRDGVADKDIAHNLGIHKATLYKYRNEHSDFDDLFARNKAYVDDVIVTNAYLKRIKGYDAVETRTEYAIIDGERIKTKETEQVRHIPGDPRAAEFWLTNRQPAKWAYKPVPKTDDDGEGGVVMMPTVMDKPSEAK